MKSILQSNKEFCYICKKNSNFEPLDEHHVFAGSLRPISEKYGLKVYLHHYSCHIFGPNSVHKNASVDWELKQDAQRKAMEHYKWTTEDFISIFGKNYL